MLRGAFALGLMALLLTAGACLESGRPEPPPPNDVALVPSPTFTQDIQPIFDEFCVKCHNAADAHGELRLDSWENVMKGGHDGKVVIPGDLEESLLFQLVTHQRETFMPFHGEKLTPNRIANVERWIELGAPE